MLKNLRLGFLFLSLLYIGQTQAATGSCTSEVPQINWYFAGDLVSEEHLRQAIMCAVNRGGSDVKGESTFRTIYDVRLDPRDLENIVIRPGKNKFNEFKSNYSLQFPAFMNRRQVQVICASASIEYKQAPFENLTFTMKCIIPGVDSSSIPLRAQVIYAPTK